MLVKTLLSLLNFYRACTGHHTIKFDSVTAMHTGVIKSFDFKTLTAIRKQLNIRKIFKLKSPSYFIPAKAGVNGNLVYVSIGYDFIALMLSPRIYIGHIKWCIAYRYYFHLLIILIFTLILSPLAVIFFIYEFLFVNEVDKLQLGRLSIIKEARQKARVVGITDW